MHHGQDGDVSYMRDARQRFSSEAKGGHAREVVESAEFRRGEALAEQRQVGFLSRTRRRNEACVSQ